MYDGNLENYIPYKVLEKIAKVLYFIYEKVVYLIFGTPSYSASPSYYARKREVSKQKREEYKKNPNRPYFDGDITHPRHYEIGQQKKIDKIIYKGTSMEKMLKYKRYQ